MNFNMKYCPRCSKPLGQKIIDQRSRLYCEDSSCGYIFWNNPVPVVAMVVETEGGIVLAHNKLFPPDVYSIITGFLETGETPEEAAIRETKEELGLDAVRANFIGIYPFAKINQLLITYHIVATGTVVLNEELDDHKIVSKDVLHGWKETQQFEVAKWLNRLSVLA